MVKKYSFNHKSNAKGGTSGSLIIGLNNKVNGINIKEIQLCIKRIFHIFSHKGNYFKKQNTNGHIMANINILKSLILKIWSHYIHVGMT